MTGGENSPWDNKRVRSAKIVGSKNELSGRLLIRIDISNVVSVSRKGFLFFQQLIFLPDGGGPVAEDWII